MSAYVKLTAEEWRFMAQRLREGAPGILETTWGGEDGCDACVCLSVALRRIGEPPRRVDGLPTGVDFPLFIHTEALDAVTRADWSREAQIAAFERMAEASAHTEKASAEEGAGK